MIDSMGTAGARAGARETVANVLITGPSAKQNSLSRVRCKREANQDTIGLRSKVRSQFAAARRQDRKQLGGRCAKRNGVQRAIGENNLSTAAVGRAPIVPKSKTHLGGVADNQYASAQFSITEAALSTARTTREEWLVPIPCAAGV